MDNKIIQLKKAIDQSVNIVVLGGAGFSTESGIPDFRSADGIYSKYKNMDPEAILSAETLQSSPELFFDFFVKEMLIEDIEPNTAHRYLAELEKRIGKNVSIITQNIDGLHQMAGSRNVIELHGSAKEYYCVNCEEKYGLEKMDSSKFGGQPPLPRCDKCAGIVRPNVVLYNESLDSSKLDRARRDMENADMVIVGGTSLKVYPANILLMYAKNAKIFTINRELIDTGRFIGDKSTVFIQRSLGETFGELMRLDKTQ